MQQEVRLLKNTIVALTSRVSELEEKSSNTVGHNESEEAPLLSNTVPAQEQVSSNVKQQQQLLQSQVQSLTVQQKNIEREKDREKRKCNVVLGNVEKRDFESAANAVLQVFKDKLSVDLSPVNAVRLGKFRVGQKKINPGIYKCAIFRKKLSL